MNTLNDKKMSKKTKSSILKMVEKIIWTYNSSITFNWFKKLTIFNLKKKNKSFTRKSFI